MPWPAVEYLAEQLAIGDASCVKKYVQRPQTPYEHAWEIRDRYGYRSFDGQGCAEAFVRFLDGRAWTHAEGPVALFEQATGWLRRNRVLLPGVTVLARQVAAAREAAEAGCTRLGRRGPQRGPRPAGAAREPAARCRTGRGSRSWSGCAARRGAAPGPEMVKALQRAEQLAALGVGRVEVDDIPANRLQVLARTGLGSKASALARLGSRSGPPRWSRWCGTWRRTRSMTRWTCSRC